MKEIFVDTGYWVALLNPRDGLHSRALAALSRFDGVRLLTTQMVLVELLARMSHPPERILVVNGIATILANPNLKVIPQSAEQFAAAFRFYVARADKAWSLTDCASFVLMSEREILESLAHDEHFEQAGFVALLKHQTTLDGGWRMADGGWRMAGGRRLADSRRTTGCRAVLLCARDLLYPDHG